MGRTMGVVSEYAIRSILMISRRSRSREASRCSPRSERRTSWSPVKSLTWRGISFASSIDGSGFTRRLTGVAAALMVVAHRSACSGSALMQRRRANMVRAALGRVEQRTGRGVLTSMPYQEDQIRTCQIILRRAPTTVADPASSQR